MPKLSSSWGLLGVLMLSGCPAGSDPIAEDGDSDTTGDGDGDSDTTGDGDGDMGDGDGDTTGDGDGDMTGDGDGDGGDGDGDPGALPDAPQNFDLELAQVKQFEFTWSAAEHAEYYQLLESSSNGEPYLQVGEDVFGLSMSQTVPLYARTNASYVVRACNQWGCTDSDPLEVIGTLVEAIGYFKASNTGGGDEFGSAVALSADGRTLVISAPRESSAATGINGDQSDDSMVWAGAVHVFVRDEFDAWSQQAYLKASNPGYGHQFGWDLALSDDGNTLAVGADGEASNATGIDGNQADTSQSGAGAVYMFVRDDLGNWTQQAYVKASNSGTEDRFGHTVSLSADGDTLAVGAWREDSASTEINGNQLDNGLNGAGAVYVFVRDEQEAWSQHTYIKPSVLDETDSFGYHVVLSGDGATLLTHAKSDDSASIGVNGNPLDNSADNAGAVFVFVRDEQDVWVQQAYVKASNTDAGDAFGFGLAASFDGDTIAIGAPGEASAATGIDGDQAHNGLGAPGAVYVFVRDQLGTWSQQAYVKPSNSPQARSFGVRVSLSNDGDRLVVGASGEHVASTGIGGDQFDWINGSGPGAAYVFIRGGIVWSQQEYVKASNTGEGDYFGSEVELSGDGNTLAVGAAFEESNATGIGGDQADDSAMRAGAAYVY